MNKKVSRKDIAYEVLMVEGELAKQILFLIDIKDKFEKCKDDSDMELLNKGLKSIVSAINQLEAFQSANSNKIDKEQKDTLTI